MLACLRELLASALLLHKDFLFTFNSNNTTIHSHSFPPTRILHCVSGSVWTVANPVPCHISMVSTPSSLLHVHWPVNGFSVLTIDYVNSGQIIVGEVEEELNIGPPPLGIYYTRDSGLYLLPEPVPNDGIITRMRALGILSDRDYELYIRNRLNPLDVSMYLFFAVFRLDTDSSSYQLIHGPEMATHTIMEPAVAKNLEWPVRAGDKIGAIVPDSCFNGTNSPPFPCPSRFNFHVPENHCLAGLYSPVNMSSVDDMDLEEPLDGISIDQFVEEQVLLNVEAKIISDAFATGMFFISRGWSLGGGVQPLMYMIIGMLILMRPGYATAL